MKPSVNDDESTIKRLGQELSSNHPAIVYGMARQSLGKLKRGFHITSATATKVSPSKGSCDLRVTLCRGDVCELRRCTYELPTTSTTSADELDDGLVSELRRTVCGPNPFWLVTDPFALVILIVCGLLGWGTWIGPENLTELLLQAPKLEQTLSSFFGSPRAFCDCVVVSFWFAIVAHAIEAAIAMYYAKTVLKLGPSQTAAWGFLVFCVGYPIFSRIQELVAVEHGHAKSK